MQKFNKGDKVLYSSKNSYIWTVEGYCRVRKVYFVNDGSTSYGIMALEEDLALYVKGPRDQSDFINKKQEVKPLKMPDLEKGGECPFVRAFNAEISGLWKAYEKDLEDQSWYGLGKSKKCSCNIHELMRSGCLCGGFQNESKSK